MQATKTLLRAMTALFAILLAMPFTYASCVKDLDKKVQRILEDGYVKYHLTGMQLSIICKDETIPHDFAVGTTTEHGITPVTPETLFQIGSNTKSFTSALMLTLEADGLLTINDEIGIWLPHVPEVWKKITIRQLLNHTSGIPDYTKTNEFIQAELASGGKKQWKQDELLQFVVQLPLEFQPGKGYFYSNTNYVLAGMIIDVALHSIGKSYASETVSRLMQPLHLTNTYYLPHAYSDDIFARMAHGYLKYDIDMPALDITAYDMSFANTAGANVSTAHDIALWMHALMHGDILPAQQLSEMMTTVSIKTGQPDEFGYGLAIQHYKSDVFLGNEEIWTHGGQTLGYTSDMLWLKCRDLVISFTNNNSSEDPMNRFMTYYILNDIYTYIRDAEPSTQCEAQRVGTPSQLPKNKLKTEFENVFTSINII